MRRNTTPSRSRRQTTAFTAAGRRYGALKYSRPLVPSFKPALARMSASPVGIFAQPSPYSVSVCTANDRVAESVPAPDGRVHQDLRVVRILHRVDQLPTRDSECSVFRVRYPIEGARMEVPASPSGSARLAWGVSRRLATYLSLFFRHRGPAGSQGKVTDDRRHLRPPPSSPTTRRSKSKRPSPVPSPRRRAGRWSVHTSTSIGRSRAPSI